MAEDTNKTLSPLPTAELTAGQKLLKAAVELSSELTSESRLITEELKDQLGLRTKLTETEKGQLDIARKVTASISENNVELRRTGGLEAQIIKDRKLQAKVQKEISSLEAGITEEARLAADKITQLNQERIELYNKFLELQRTERTNIAGIGSELEEVYRTASKALEDKEEELKRAVELADSETQRLAILKEVEKAQEKNIASRQKEAVEQAKVTKAIGLTGAFLDNINRIGFRVFGGLGVNLATFGEELKTAKEKADELGEELALTEAGEGLSTFEKRVRVMKVTFEPIKKAIKSTLTDPLTLSAGIITKIGGAIIKAFKEVDKVRVEFERLNGSASSLNIQMMSYNRTLTDTVDLLKQAASFTQQTGFNAEVFSKEIITGAAEAVNLLGLTNEQAGKLGILATATGQSFEATKNSLISSVNSFNAMNKTAVSHGLVMRDVANTSDAVAASLGSSEKSITGAAAAARRLGLELKDLDSIASSLLDFESSIEAELEAQLLTGRALNLTKARELALSNDLEGVGKELFNNSASLFEFGKMNRIQQEGYAKALGLSRDQLAKIAYQRAIENNLTGEALKNATGMTAQQLEAMELTVMMEKAMSKLAQTFVPIVSLAAEYSSIIIPTVSAYATLQFLSKSILALETIRAGIAARQLALETATNAQRLIGVKRLALQAAAAAVANPVKAIAGLVVAGAIASYFATKGDDVISPGQGYGQRTLLMPEGAIALNDKDTVIAGTNLTGGANTNNRSNEETNQLLRQLIAETRKGRNIYLGPSKVSENLEVYA